MSLDFNLSIELPETLVKATAHSIRCGQTVVHISLNGAGKWNVSGNDWRANKTALEFDEMLEVCIAYVQKQEARRLLLVAAQEAQLNIPPTESLVT